MRGLITETLSDLHELTQFPEWVKVDKDRVITCGHSFGGITVLSTAFEDTRVKATLTMDPWTFVKNDDIMSGAFRLDIPHCAINSRDFKRLCHFEVNDYISHFFMNSTSLHKESYILDRITHE